MTASTTSRLSDEVLLLPLLLVDDLLLVALLRSESGRPERDGEDAKCGEITDSSKEKCVVEGDGDAFGTVRDGNANVDIL